MRRLVTLLTIVMIGGLLTIVALLVIRLGGSPAPGLPASINLPSGAVATAFTQGDDWYAVVIEGAEILIYNRSDNSLRQRIQIDPEG